MQEPRVPEDELDRLSALCALDILDTPGEERFDRITRMLQELFKVPIACIAMVDENRQWFKSMQGLSAGELHIRYYAGWPLPRVWGRKYSWPCNCTERIRARARNSNKIGRKTPSLYYLGISV